MPPDVEPQLEKKLRTLLECKHSIHADSCAECKGKTRYGKTTEEIIEEFLHRGTIIVEMEDRHPTHGRNFRRLKTVIGIGLGISVAGGFLAWKGGKLVMRLIRRDAAPKP